MLHATANLRCRDLGAALGVASRISITQQAGADEARNGKAEDQRYRCDLS